MDDIARITSSEMKAACTDAEITDTKIIASYNWDKRRSRTILVPGFPPVLQKASVMYQLQKDTEDHPIYLDARNYPDFPMESLFAAVNICTPSFDFQGIHIVTDRNSLRKLMFFLNGKDDEFSFFIDKVGNLLIFTRYDPVGLNDCVGYGHNFEKRNTKYNADYGDPASYHCIAEYHLGNFAIVVRAEVDAVKPKRSLYLHESSAVPISKSRVGSSLKCIQVGKLIDKTTNEMYELKSQSSRFFHQFRWEETYFQMALGAADVLMVGHHKYGFIESVGKHRIQQVKEKSGVNTAAKFGALETLLQWIKDKVERASFSDNHAVFQVKYDPILGNHLVINKLQLHQGKIPQWIIKKYGTKH